MSDKGRVVFLIKLKPGMSEQFLEAYEAISHEVAAGVPGEPDWEKAVRDEGVSWPNQ